MDHIEMEKKQHTSGWLLVLHQWIVGGCSLLQPGYHYMFGAW